MLHGEGAVYHIVHAVVLRNRAVECGLCLPGVIAIGMKHRVVLVPLGSDHTSTITNSGQRGSRGELVVSYGLCELSVVKYEYVCTITMRRRSVNDTESFILHLQPLEFSVPRVARVYHVYVARAHGFVHLVRARRQDRIDLWVLLRHVLPNAEPVVCSVQV